LLQFRALLKGHKVAPGAEEEVSGKRRKKGKGAAASRARKKGRSSTRAKGRSNAEWGPGGTQEGDSEDEGQQSGEDGEEVPELQQGQILLQHMRPGRYYSLETVGMPGWEMLAAKELPEELQEQLSNPEEWSER
jgi:hypothetical protein